MENQRTILFFASIVIILINSSSIFALNTIGPPMANLQQEEWSLGLEYGRSDMDIETSSDYRTEVINGTTVPPALKSKYEITNLQTNKLSANMGLGISYGWDMYLKLDISDAQADIKETQDGGATGDRYKGFDGTYGLGFGIGTKVTFIEDENLTWGGLLMANWSNPGTSDVTIAGDPYFSGKADLSYWEIQMAAGPTFNYDYFRIYGGPFLHFISGDFDLDGTGTYPGPTTISLKSSQNIEKDLKIGAFFGAQFDLTEQSNWFAECQFTSDSWGLGLGITWEF